MKKQTLRLGFVVGAFLVGWWVARSTTPVGAQGGARSFLRYGALVQSDQPIYPVGSTATVAHGVYNFSNQDVWMLIGIFGGNGCSYRIDLLDAQGQVVWEPGRISGGQFIPPLCSRRPSVPVLLGAGSERLSSREPVALVYQNGSGIGTLGDPLPPGFYSLRFTAGFIGPHSSAHQVGGFAPTASTPIQIVP